MRCTIARAGRKTALVSFALIMCQSLVTERLCLGGISPPIPTSAVKKAKTVAVMNPRLMTQAKIAGRKMAVAAVPVIITNDLAFVYPPNPQLYFWALQSSVDLLHWTNIAVYNVPTNPGGVCSVTNSRSRLFYRLKGTTNFQSLP